MFRETKIVKLFWLQVQGFPRHPWASLVGQCAQGSRLKVGTAHSACGQWTRSGMRAEDRSFHSEWKRHHSPLSRDSAGLGVLPGHPGGWGKGALFGEKSRKTCTHWCLGSAAVLRSSDSDHLLAGGTAAPHRGKEADSLMGWHGMEVKGGVG